MRHIVVDGSHVQIGNIPEGKFLKRQGGQIVGADAPAGGQHDHEIADVTGLQTALDSKGTSNFSGGYADLTGTPSTFTPTAHNQAISTITGLQAALDGKQDAGSYAGSTHDHNAAYEALGAVAAHAGEGAGERVCLFGGGWESPGGSVAGQLRV
jgi:hypothetical protein